MYPTSYQVNQWYPGNNIPEGAIIHYAESISDWSWGATLIVYEFNGRFYICEEEDNSAYGDGNGDYHFYETGAECALDKMLEFEESKGNLS